jgi:hypothetical protein
MTELVFVVPGRLDQLTGGYLFDRHIVEGLRARGRIVRVIELTAGEPRTDRAALAAVADGTKTVVDGLALANLEQKVAAQARRLHLIAFVHGPLAQETGLSSAEATRAAQLEAALLSRFRGVLCPSRRTAGAVESYGISPDRIAIVPPGTAKPNRHLRPRRRRVREPRRELGPAQESPSSRPRAGRDPRPRLAAALRLSLKPDQATTLGVRQMISAAGPEGLRDASAIFGHDPATV